MYRLARRLARPLAFLVIAAQLLLAVPAMANATVSAAAATEMHCDHMKAHGDAPCPCCPDGVDSTAACLAACSAAFGITASVSVSQVRADSPRVSLPIVTAHSRVFDPPLKPPPIA